MASQRQSRRAFLRRSAAGMAGLWLGGALRARAAGTERPNIVVIVMDTVRRDHLSCCGYARPTSPFLEELAETSRMYDMAYATSCWTVPSHASLFTGLYPVSHWTHWEHIRHEEGLVTLAEVLKGEGYRTIGLCENWAILPKLGLTQGFERFVPGRLVAARRRDTCKEFEDWVEQKGAEPLFAFVNLNAAHANYNSSRQFFKLFLTDPAYEDQYSIDPSGAIIQGRNSLSPEWLKHLAEHYDAEVRYVDFQVEQMACVLKSHGLWDSTLFIVTSDHGENLGDHGLLDHQFCLYETLVRIPLIVHYPERFPAASHEPRPVQLVDVFPTVIELLGLEPKAFPTQGRSLLPGRATADREVLCEYYLHHAFTTRRGRARMAHPNAQKYNRRLKSIRVGNLKLIQGSDGRDELYDLGEDLDETRDLSAEPACANAKARLTRLLDERIETYRLQNPPPPEALLDTDEVGEDHMRALGYL